MTLYEHNNFSANLGVYSVIVYLKVRSTKILVKFKKMVKNCALNLNYRHQIKIVLFVMIPQNMLLDEIFRMV